MWWQYFLYSKWMLEQCIFFILNFMNVKIVGSWKNEEYEKYYCWSEKSWIWFLKQEKAVKKKRLRKKRQKNIKEKEKASRKSQ